MNFNNLVITAVRSLTKNKMRSSLTSLGVIIGVASVIMMVGIGNSARVAVRDKVFTYGANAMSVTAAGKPFTERDIINLKRNSNLIKNITPVSVRMTVTIKYQSQNMSSRLSGVNNDFFHIKDWPLMYGRYFTELEILSLDKVVIVGNTVRTELFGFTNPVGNVISINNTPYKVVGALEELGQALSGRDQDNVIVVPYTTAGVKLIGKKNFDEIFISTYSEQLVDKTVQDVRNYFRSDRSIMPAQEEDFKISTSKDMLQMVEYISKTLALLLAGIASISLVVGGIGIMNIMLVSVSERTREIGIRMAIGAKRNDILVQFLIEAITLSIGGGTAGILIGMFIYYLITLVAGWPFLLSIFSILISFLFSGAVGIFFGYYPARKASNLKPIDALRYE